MTYYRGEIMKCVSICWCRLDEVTEPASELAAVRESLQNVVKVLVAACSEFPAFESELESLINADGRLQSLVAP